jgi:DNA-binding HxlR family transcriptional regulator
MPHAQNGTKISGTKLDSPVHLMLSYIGGKWAILILQELFQGSRRTNEFLSALPGISTKTLTARLRELESYGLVKRTVFPEVPPRVEYALTAKGQEVQPIMAALDQVGQHWLIHSPASRPTTLYGTRSR